MTERRHTVTTFLLLMLFAGAVAAVLIGAGIWIGAMLGREL